MRILIILYLALGLSLMVSIEYSCQGSEIFPTYYSSPFIFKQKSLGSSMEYFYSISGLVLNVLTWATFLYILDKLTLKIREVKRFRVISKVILGLFLTYATITIIINSATIGTGFSKNLNYWYWTNEKSNDNSRFECGRKLLLFTSFKKDSDSIKNDQIFGASDELHSIRLYKNEKSFKILYNGINTAIGNYTLIGDTVKLNYTENQFKEFDPNVVLTRTLLIDSINKSIKSIDKHHPFCAIIHLDRRESQAVMIH